MRKAVFVILPLSFSIIGVMPISSANAKCKRDGGTESCGIETRGGAGSSSSGGSSNAARNQAIIGGVAGLISGIISNSDRSDAVIADPEKALPRFRSLEKLFEPSKESYEQRKNELFTRGEAEARKKVLAAKGNSENNPFGKKKSGSSGPANAADCLSIEDRYFFRNNCDYKVIFTFRTLGGGCFEKNYGTDTVAARRRVTTAVAQKCGGTRGKQIEYVACEYKAWAKNACRLKFVN